MIYLDNAATTFPKPIPVIEEVRRCMLTYAGNPGRGAHALSLMAAERVYECRELLARMFGAEDVDRVFFIPNTTYGINSVIKGTLKRGDHVIISDMEHNAVFRPIYKLAEAREIEYDVFDTCTCQYRQNPDSICQEILKLVRPNTKMVFCVHGSNICSEVLPIAQIGKLCKRLGIFFAVDGAQSAGHVPIDIGKMNIDALCLPGHKGLYGPQGSGAVILGKEIVLDTLVEGGNGIDSLSGEMSAQSPERYEAGTVAVPAIAGFYAALKWLDGYGIERIGAEEKRLGRRLTDMLGSIRGVSVYAPQYEGGTVLFNIDGVSSESCAAYLSTRGICTRGGYHCAALAHGTLGTPEGGAVRASVGMFNTEADISGLWRALRDASFEKI
ncbi:MAG: aminotransferase class V-fold PLP-dependent enzyme [Ruminococcaceae bacterium]|nr:aminotransferase class V-fold PLP-dependent enzyme [Oscillospiraceae bacterium]